MISRRALVTAVCAGCLSVGLGVSVAAIAILIIALELLDPEGDISICQIIADLEQMIYMLVWDKTERRWVVRECSPGCEAIYGHSRDEMKAKTFNIIDHIHPEDARRIEAMSEIEFPVGFNFVYEKRARGREAGSPYRWIRSKAVLLSEDACEQVWLGMFDDISDLKAHGEELDRVRSHIAALERGIGACFQESFYLDKNCAISKSYWDFEECRDFRDLIVSENDLDRFTKYVSEPLSDPARRRPVTIDLSLGLFGRVEHPSVATFQLLAVRMPLDAGEPRMLVGLRKIAFEPRSGSGDDLRLLDVGVEGDIDSVAGFVFGCLPTKVKEVFGRLWRNSASVDDIFERLDEQTEYLGVAYLCGVVHLIVLSLVRNRLPVLDKVKLLETCLERSLTIRGRRGAQLSFQICLCSMTIPDISCSVAAFFFDRVIDKLMAEGSFCIVSYAALLCVQRGVHFARKAQLADADRFFEEGVRLSQGNDDSAVQVKALALFNAYVAKPQKRKLQRLKDLISQHDHRVVFDEAVLRGVAAVEQ